MSDCPKLSDPDANALHRGDVMAFEQLVGRLQAGLFGFIGRMGFSQADTEELVQEVFLAVWRNRTRYDPARAGLSTWVYVIARSVALNELARRTRGAADQDARSVARETRDPEAIAADPNVADPLRRAERSQQVNRLRTALRALPADDRVAIALFYARALSVEEAARVCGCSAGTFRTRLSRARKRLAQLVQKTTNEVSNG